MRGIKNWETLRVSSQTQFVNLQVGVVASLFNGFCVPLDPLKDLDRLVAGHKHDHLPSPQYIVLNHIELSETTVLSPYMWVYSCQEILKLRNILPMLLQRNFILEIMIIHDHPRLPTIIPRLEERKPSQLPRRFTWSARVVSPLPCPFPTPNSSSPRRWMPTSRHGRAVRRAARCPHWTWTRWRRKRWSCFVRVSSRWEKLMEMLKCLGNLEESGRIWETYGDDWEKRWEKLILNEKNQAMGMSKGVKYLWFSWKGSGGWSMSVLAHQHDGNTFTILYLYPVVHHHFSGETMQLFILFFRWYLI